MAFRITKEDLSERAQRCQAVAAATSEMESGIDCHAAGVSSVLLLVGFAICERLELIADRLDNKPLYSVR